MNIVGVVRCVGFILVIGISTGRSQQWVPVAMPDSVDYMRFAADDANSSRLGLLLRKPLLPRNGEYLMRTAYHVSTNEGNSWHLMDTSSLQGRHSDVNGGNHDWVELILHDSVATRIGKYLFWESALFAAEVRTASGRFKNLPYPENGAPGSGRRMRGSPWLAPSSDGKLVNLFAVQSPAWDTSTFVGTVYLCLYGTDSTASSWQPLLPDSCPKLRLHDQTRMSSWGTGWDSEDFAFASSLKAPGMYAVLTSLGLHVTHDSSRTWTSPNFTGEADLWEIRRRMRSGANKLLLLHPADAARAYALWPQKNHMTLLLRSIDGLASVHVVAAKHDAYSIASLATDPRTIAVVGDSVFVSRDGGDHWSDSLPLPVGWSAGHNATAWIHLLGDRAAPTVMISNGRMLWKRQLSTAVADPPSASHDVMLTVSPQPVGEYATASVLLHGAGGSTITLLLYDTLGRLRGSMLVETQMQGTSHATLSPAAFGLGSGVYWITASQNGGQSRTRFVVE